MRKILLAFALAALCASARAQLTSSGNQTITGQTGVGTYAPLATLDVMESPADAYALWVASQNGAGLLVVNSTGQVGIGLTSPGARVDVTGSGDNGDIGLQLRSGNSSTTFSSSQILFVYGSSGAFAHSLVTRAVMGQYLGNELDFFLWRSTPTPLTPGTLKVLSLQPINASSASVHVMPYGTPVYDLTVSSAFATGGGNVMAAAYGPHSSRAFKTVLAAYGDKEADQAYADVKSLKPARFRYKSAAAVSPVIRGLIYEDAPAAIRDERGKSISLDARLVQMELALSAADRRIKDLEKKISDAERGGRR